MPRKRDLSPAFFTHEDLYQAEIGAALPLRLAFAGLWCAADREGRFEWRARLKLEVLPYDPVDFMAVLTALESNGFLLSYEVAGKRYGWIPTFGFHQKPHPREAPSRLPAPPEVIVAEAHRRWPALGQPGDGLRSAKVAVPSGPSDPQDLQTLKPANQREGHPREGLGPAVVVPAVVVAKAANAGLRRAIGKSADTSPLLASQATEQVGEWLQAGIPLKLIVETVEAAAERFKPQGRNGRISSFSYFDNPVRRAHEAATVKAESDEEHTARLQAAARAAESQRKVS